MVVMDSGDAPILDAARGRLRIPRRWLRRSRLRGASRVRPFKPLLRGGDESRKLTAGDGDQRLPRFYQLGPPNYEKEFKDGALRTALAHSINTVAIKVMSQVTLPSATASD